MLLPIGGLAKLIGLPLDPQLHGCWGYPLFGFMLIKGFPRQLTTVEALRDGPNEARREELRRRSAHSRARLAALLAPKHRPKRRGITNW